MRTLSLIILFIVLIPTLGVAGVLLALLAYWLGWMYAEHKFIKRMAAINTLNPKRSIFPS